MTDKLVKHQNDSGHSSNTISTINPERKEELRILDEEFAAQYAEYAAWIGIYEDKYGEDDAISTWEEEFWESQRYG
jgi:hypothetical protein